MQALLPAGWPRPKGYANGVAAQGRQIFVAGMIGWDAQGVFHRPTTSPRRCARRCATSWWRC
jgi:enamine deaminase RidA (YjgF/YER057c/UK114 family)